MTRQLTLTLLTGLSFFTIQPSAPAGMNLQQGGGEGNPEPSQACNNTGASWHSPAVIAVGPPICTNSNGVDFVIGKDASNSPVSYTSPACPSFIEYSQGHSGVTAKSGYRATPQSLVPNLKQEFTCIDDPLFEACTTGTVTPGSAGSMSYREAACDQAQTEAPTQGMLR